MIFCLELRLSYCVFFDKLLTRSPIAVKVSPSTATRSDEPTFFLLLLWFFEAPHMTSQNLASTFPDRVEPAQNAH